PGTRPKKGDRSALTLFASNATLSRGSGLSEKQLRRQMRELRLMGLLELKAPGGGRRRFGSRIGGVHSTFLVRLNKLPTHATVSDDALPYPCHEGDGMDANPSHERQGIEVHTPPTTGGTLSRVLRTTESKELRESMTARSTSAPLLPSSA